MSDISYASSSSKIYEKSSAAFKSVLKHSVNIYPTGKTPSTGHDTEDFSNTCGTKSIEPKLLSKRKNDLIVTVIGNLYSNLLSHFTLFFPDTQRSINICKWAKTLFWFPGKTHCNLHVGRNWHYTKEKESIKKSIRPLNSNGNLGQYQKYFKELYFQSVLLRMGTILKTVYRTKQENQKSVL